MIKQFIFTTLIMGTIMNVVGQTIPTKDGQLALKIYSGQLNETVILLHGGPGVPDGLEEVAGMLSSHYRVVTFDQRGTGASTNIPGDYSVEAYISDIDAIADYLGVSDFHLFGHSWGGLYAQIYMDRRAEKVKSLFLCSPSSGTGIHWVETEKEVMQFNKSKAEGSEWMKMGWYSLKGMMGSDKAYKKLFQIVMRNYHKGFDIEEGSPDWLEKIHSDPINKTRKELKHYPLLQTFENAEIPILITYGEGDIYGDSKQQVLKRYPHGKMMTISNSGHIPWKHNPEQFEEIVTRFFDLEDNNSSGE